MDTQDVQKNWTDIKAKIRAKWNKISEAEIDGFKENLDKLSEQIQKTYGIAKNQAETEFNEFKKSLQSIKVTDKGAKV